MSETKIDYKYSEVTKYGSTNPVYGCTNEKYDVKDANNNEVQKTIATDYYIEWNTGSGIYGNDRKFVHTVKMDQNAKNWTTAQKEQFVQELEDLSIISNTSTIDGDNAKPVFDIMFYDCINKTNKTWYSYGSKFGSARNVVRSIIGRRFGGKSQKRRVIRRRRSTRRRGSKTRRSRT